MDPQVLEIVGPVVAILGIGSMILIGIKMRYTHLRDTRHQQVGLEELERLAEDIERLRDEVRLLREESADMSERLEFTERVLSRGKAAERDSDALPRR